MLPEIEDLYKILGVDREASQQEIAQAYRAKALAYHPDRVPAAATEEVRRLAEEHMSVVNNAHGVLSDPVKRQAYDADWNEGNSPPKPMVEPSSILLENLAVGESRRASFVIRNIGGPYEKIWFDEPKNSGLTILNWLSLESDDELPLQVDIEVTGKEWGKRYSEIITVRLDDVETTINIEVITKNASAPKSSYRKIDPGSPNYAQAPGAGVSHSPRNASAVTNKNRDLALLHLAFLIAAGGSFIHIFWSIRAMSDWNSETAPFVYIGALVPGVAMVIADFIWSVRKNRPNGQVEGQWLWLSVIAPFVGIIVMIIALVFYVRGLTTLLND